MPWLLFVATLPGQNGGLRVRFWRQMKSLGAAILRDGVYLLPRREDLKESLEESQGELSAAGASAYVLDLAQQEAALENQWIGLFDRGEAYRECQVDLDALLKRLREWSEAEARRQFRLWHKSLEAVVAIDYFPGEARERAQRGAAEAEARLTRYYSPDEPLPAHRAIARLARREYQGRRWATRRRPWVDRIACAWLIRRFIDRDATFTWLGDIRRAPKDALTFDFDGASFTHVDDKVTFEVLLHAFSLEKDAALLRIGAMVHALDVGGEPTPEASGFEAMLSGARARIDDDDQLLAEMAGVLDSLYVHFQGGKSNK
ncbi:MAG TPA: chromate resistance protein ChrB domain-containing protein [Burkholderiaceae bacterium]|nr:chromate resistance protein ChrB domain-containing protein [Burkholderiaceae bacterium]